MVRAVEAHLYLGPLTFSIGTKGHQEDDTAIRYICGDALETLIT